MIARQHFSNIIAPIASISKEKCFQYHLEISNMNTQTFWNAWLEAELPDNMNEKFNLVNPSCVWTSVESLHVFPEITILAQKLLPLSA
jgi:hypothetical protein